jgi:hypothetical protein
MKYFSLISSIIFLAVMYGCSQNHVPKNFMGILLASENDKYIKEWISTNHLKGIHVLRQDSAVVNRPLQITFVTSLFGTRNDSLNVSVNVRIIKPDGKCLVDEPKYAMINNKIETNKTMVMLPTALNLGFEESDQKGTYLVIGRFIDAIDTKEYTDTLKIKLR